MFAAIVQAGAITFTYDNLDKTKKTCRIAGWGGTEPASGKLTLKSTYTKDNVTYTVTAIAPWALNNLISTYEITIPASIVKIGDIDAVEPEVGAKNGSIRNFAYCPKLTKFIVEDGNTVFTANDQGWLMSKGGRNVYRIPAGGEYTDGHLKMSNYVHYIFADAFVGNTGVTKVTLSSGLKAYYPSCGLCKLTNVTEYSVASSSTTLSVTDGVLFNKKANVIFAYPPKKSGETYTIPSSVGTIADFAFAHNRTLRTVNYSSVRVISESAFEDATYLYVVNGPAPSNIRRRAFYSAMNLSSFPFSGSTALEGDSIFFGTGFTGFKFDDDVYLPSSYANRFTFSDERLGSINMGNMVFAGNTDWDIYPFYSDFASGCTSLENVTLPKRCVFKKDKGRAAFTGTFNMQYIETGSFRVEDGNVPFVFSTYNTTSNTLRIFTATNSSTADIDKYAEWGSLISYSGAGGISPVIYTDMAKPYAPDAQSHYIYRTNRGYATYYVPGLCGANYQEAKDKYCPVYEMFDVKVITKGANAVVRLKASYDFVHQSAIKVNGGEAIKVSGDGDYDTGVAIDQLDNVRVEYSVIVKSPYHAGPAMSTTYHREDFGLSGIDDVAADVADVPVEYFDLRGIKVAEPSHGVYIRRQGAEVTKVVLP